jgi:hypothetical protein
METINCRNCGAPHDGKCDYCGTDYNPNVVPKSVNKKPLNKKLQLAVVAIGLIIIFPAVGIILLKKHSFK